MAKPYSEDLRARVVAAIDAGATRPEVVDQYSVSLSSVGRFVRLDRETGSVSAAKFGGYKEFALAGSAALPRDRTANPVEQRAIRSFAPARTPNIRAKAIRSPASTQLPQRSRRRQIPIAPVAPSVPHIPRFAALALFGRRLAERGDGLHMPASENLHKLRHRTCRSLQEKAARRRLSIQGCCGSSRHQCWLYLPAIGHEAHPQES